MDPKHTNVIDCSNSDEEDILIPSDSEFSSIDASDNENSSQASSEERPPISSEDPVPPPPKRSKRDGDIIRVCCLLYLFDITRIMNHKH